MATVRLVLCGQLYRPALMLNDFPPTAAIVGTKADFTLSQRHGSSRIADSCEIIIEGVLEPHAVKDHESPASVVGIGFLGPMLTAPSNSIKAVFKQTPKLSDAET